jgi:hypothetical protein
VTALAFAATVFTLSFAVTETVDAPKCQFRVMSPAKVVTDSKAVATAVPSTFAVLVDSNAPIDAVAAVSTVTAIV